MRRRRGRRGGVLVLVAFALFGLMALAALTVDLGRARAVQVDLQVAADRGALEAIRQRDVADDAFRRQRARQPVRTVRARRPR